MESSQFLIGLGDLPLGRYLLKEKEIFSEER